MRRKKIGMALITLGIIIIAAAIIMRYYGYIKQKKIIDQFQKTIENMDKSKQNEKDSLSKTETKEGTIGIISIPKINLKVALSEGIDMKTLKYAVGHFKGTAMPGQKGNFCAAGHRSYTYNEFFNRLDELEPGDEITVQTRENNFKYKVYKKMVVEPKDYWVLDPTKDSEITLVTCTPIRIASKRLIIKGKLQ